MTHYSRMSSDEPEPLPNREEGYYWIEAKPKHWACNGDEEPYEFIAYYGSCTMNDQKAGSRETIISEYRWGDGDGESAGWTDNEVIVLSPRLIPPSESK